MAKKLNAAALKRISTQYRDCVSKCQQTATELRGASACAAAEAEIDIQPGFRIDVTALSQRELEVFALIGYGLTTKQIAKHAELTSSTVETYRERLKKKLKFETSTALMRAAVIWTVELGGRPLP